MKSEKWLRFQESACLIDVSFWQCVIQQKLNTWKLSCPPMTLRAQFDSASSQRAKPVIRIDANCASPRRSRTRFDIGGTFYHVNTLEDLINFPFSQTVASTLTPVVKFANKDFVSVAPRSSNASSSSSDPKASNESFDWDHLADDVLNSFLVVAFIDLKRYAMVYCVSCPTVGFHAKTITVSPGDGTSTECCTVPKIPSNEKRRCDRYLLVEPSQPADQKFSWCELAHVGRHLLDLCCCHNGEDRQSTARLCLIYKINGRLEFMSISNFHRSPNNNVLIRDILRNNPNACIATVDFAKAKTACSWPLRNVLFCLCQVLELYSSNIRLLAFRDVQSIPNPQNFNVQSRLFYIHVPDKSSFANRMLVAGWLNHSKSANINPFNEALHGSKLPLPSNALFTLNLQSFLDNRVVQQNATELNVKLIKWRILPAFQPHRIQQLRFLLIGMGTLGCHIARELVGWGVLKMTLVDCASVAPSNPARQSLYQARDVESESSSTAAGGHRRRSMSKVAIAKERLLEVRGDLDIRTIELEIPMPNQERFLLPVDKFLGTKRTGLEDSRSYAAWMHDELRNVIRNSDCVLLLTDSRESRWLPSLICQNVSYVQNLKEQTGCENLNIGQGPLPAELREKVENKATSVDHREKSPFSPPLCMTVALGFDTFVVIRHGSYCDAPLPRELQHLAEKLVSSESLSDLKGIYRRCDTFGSRLSCYFCNDLSAPSSIASRHRTLDQQCTVTRTGIAAFASAIAVESLTALSQAPYGFGAMPPDRREEIANKLRKNSDDWAPEDVAAAWESTVNTVKHSSCLGDCPHVTRGSVASFNLRSDWHPAFDLCVCCSEAVQKAYFAEGAKFVEDVVRDSSRLEKISGLIELRKVSDARGALVAANNEESLTDVDVLILDNDDSQLQPVEDNER